MNKKNLHEPKLKRHQLTGTKNEKTMMYVEALFIEYHNGDVLFDAVYGK